MSGLPSPTGPVEPPERTPAAIRAELPEELRGRFDAEYQAALEEARASYRLDRLNEVVQTWWQLVWARRSPRHEEAIETGHRLLRGEEVETFRVDLDALRQQAVYQVEYSWAARAQADSLPLAGRRALADAIERLQHDPWQGQRVPDYPPEFRTWPFGDGGLVVYLSRERQATVVLLDLIWAGPQPPGVIVVPDQNIERALVVVAHPDDVDFWAGGTVACWTSAGIAVVYCVLTDGDSGGFDPGVPRAAIPGIRRAEQEAAAVVLGVSHVRFLGYPDGRLEPSHALRRDITRVIRQVRPERVLTWTPEWSWRRFHRNHPDHRAVGEAVLSAVFPDARNPFAHPELLSDDGLEPQEVGEVWLMGAPSPNHYVDITDTFERKLAALRAHKSQTAHRGRLAEILRERLAPNSEAAGLPAGRLAEAFQVVTFEQQAVAGGRA